MNTRLQQFIAAENITQAQLADRLKVARAGVSHIIAGRNKPSYDFLSALMQHFPNLNVEWLMFGKGKMYKEKTADTPALLFNMNDTASDDDDLLFPAQDYSNHEARYEPNINIETTNNINDLDKVCKVVEKQRNVKKIIILFDDGTFQEM